MKSYQRQFIEFALNKQGVKVLISSTPGCLIPGAIWHC